MGGGTVKVIAETVDEQGWSCTVYFGQDDEARDAMRAFSDQLRTGQLVAVSDDAIERATQIADKLVPKTKRRMAGENFEEQLSTDKWDIAFRAAFTAMKDTQPALTAKGTGDE